MKRLNHYEKSTLLNEFERVFCDIFISQYTPIYKENGFKQKPNPEESKFLLMHIIFKYRKPYYVKNNEDLINHFEKDCNKQFLNYVEKSRYSPNSSILLTFERIQRKRMTDSENVISYEESVQQLFD